MIETVSNRLANVFLLSGMCLLQLNAAVAAPAAKPAQKTPQWIFSRSNTPSNADILGFSGVPAQVNFPSGSPKQGVYITKSDPEKPASHMGLRPGTVLLSIDKTPTTKPSDADTILRTHASGKVQYSYVIIDRSGIPQVMTSLTSLVNSTTPGSPAAAAQK